ncbi:MAG: hypothetical protein ACRDQY_14130 [Pseudonocardiaceae bacterium]
MTDKTLPGILLACGLALRSRRGLGLALPTVLIEPDHDDGELFGGFSA